MKRGYSVYKRKVMQIQILYSSKTSAVTSCTFILTLPSVYGALG